MFARHVRLDLGVLREQVEERPLRGDRLTADVVDHVMRALAAERGQDEAAVLAEAVALLDSVIEDPSRNDRAQAIADVQAWADAEVGLEQLVSDQTLPPRCPISLMTSSVNLWGGVAEGHSNNDVQDANAELICALIWK